MPNRVALLQWVEEVARQTEPKRVVWCDGSDEEYHQLIEDMQDDRTLIRLNQKEFPGCYLHRSHTNDVARTEKLTFICTPRRADAGPTNNWMSPKDAQETVFPLFRGAMRGRTMYVVPYLMGPARSEHSRVGVELTDSPYVVASMRIMCRMGRVAMEQIGKDGQFVAFFPSAVTPDLSITAANCRPTTASVTFDSRSCRVSPTHKIGVSPAFSATSNLAATTASFSPKTLRRSEWPTITWRQPKSTSISAPTAPVNAPEPC